jgi:Replicative DNA helicase
MYSKKTAYPVPLTQGSINKKFNRKRGIKMNIIILSQVLYDEDAERAILGSLIVYPDIQKSIIASLTTDDFYLQKHKIIYQTITDLVHQGKTPNLHILKDALEKQGQLDAVDGIGYLFQLSDESVPPEIAYQIVDILKEKTKAEKPLKKLKRY